MDSAVQFKAIERERLLARLGAVGLVAAVLVSTAMRWRGHEPYPGLLLPDFVGVPGRYEAAEIRSVLVDETEYQISLNLLFSDLPASHRYTLLRRMFRGEARSGRRFVFRLAERFPSLGWPKEPTIAERENEIRDWLRRRMNDLFPGERVKRVEFEWQRIRIELDARPLAETVEAKELLTMDLLED